MTRIVDAKTALREAYSSAPAAEVIIDTLEISHDLLEQPIRVMRDPVPGGVITVTLEDGTGADFFAVGFDVTLPELSEGGTPEMVIKLDNVDRAITDALEKVVVSQQPTSIIYRAWLASDLTTPQIQPIAMTVTTVTADALSVNIRARFAQLHDLRAPNLIYNDTDFPGLVV